MNKMNSVEKSQYINRRYKEYLRSSFQFGSGKLQKLFEDQLAQEELFKGPYVDLSLPFERGKNIDELIQSKEVCGSFSKLGDVNFTRPLYSHQQEAIEKIGKGRSAIITTGTGSGKTESFLYPILNELLADLEHGNREIGIRAIFLYPMNALVNDQIERVRALLSTCPEITYGFFTGETEEKVAKNYREKYGQENNVVIPSNELVSREEIRNNPPHLLFTNYSMLEYLLIRPNDYAIFTPERLRNWKFVVLDEAHSYTGSLGIELSMLMRRLTGLAPQKPRFILTSATLGQQGKSEREIIDFARSLTSASFEIDDIIFSKRIKLSSQSARYRVAGSDYTLIKSNIANVNQVRDICRKYISTEGNSVGEVLYDLLHNDENVYSVYSALKDGCKTFTYILSSVSGVNEKELIDLIDLINMAEKDGIGLFDLKYHSFVRPLAGAYITVGNNQKLSLTKTNAIDDLKAFEIGNCRYCSSPYIIGKIQHNDVDQLDYLYQNKEVDIYENYGQNEFVRLDYFLLENAVSDEEIDLPQTEDYVVCAKCGCVHDASNLNARTCACGKGHEVHIFRVVQKEDDEAVFNNINQCPCCGHKSRSGVVRGLNLGKDEGTALIAQMLYEAIDEGEDTEKKVGKLSLKAKPNTNNEQKPAKVKQFLAFSDSRQQASFAAAFLDANHVRMLRKRLIWKAIEDHNYRDLTVDEVAAYLESEIKGKKLFSNDMTAHKNAWLAVMVDLLRVDGAYDGEGLGLYYFDLDLSDIMDNFTEEDIAEEYGKYNITKTDLTTIMQVVFDVFKVTPAIHYVQSTLTPQEKLDNLEYRRFDNYVEFELNKTVSNIRSFLPVKGHDNMVVRYVQKVCGCSDAEAKEMLRVLFLNLAAEGGLFKKHDTRTAYQIDASKYIVKNYRSSKYYRCSKCGRLTPYNVHNVCVQDKCDGVLQEVNPDEALAANFYRQMYKTKKIESIVVKEHTAQLDRKTAKEYQDEFKNKTINILSCSTTFEMGIDIGALETVFMRNVPPTPANYVQRAGRAGRRRDSSAYILTYCGTGSHDYTYFTEPEEMISGVIRPPYFNVLNKKIIIRHLMATCLGFFFRANPDYFKSIDGLVFDNGVEAFKEYVASHPVDLGEYIDGKIIPGDRYSEYHNFKWFDAMDGNDEKMNHFVETIREMADEYEKAKTSALADGKYTEAGIYAQQEENLHKLKVIDSLSKYCVIPKYGFPVDVVELQVYIEGVLSSKYDLSRDLRVAISEYAPDSEIIVDGSKYTSKYITLPKTTEFPRHFFVTCPTCKKVNVALSNRTMELCRYCGKSLEETSAEYFIEPINGFKTGVTKESTRMKPKRSYAGEVTYLGGGIKDETIFRLGNYLSIETSSDDELLVMNRSDFYMCPVCGYSEIVKGRNNIPSKVFAHKNYRQLDCSCEELQLEKLGHRFQTDVARFNIPMLESTGDDAYSKALSFMYAFVEGVSKALGIERTDIDGVLEMNPDQGSYDILLYDNVPGGAGHVKRLMEKDAVINSLKEAMVKVSQECCDENTSCYNCLRNYYNQSYHNRLRRIYAKEYLTRLLNAEFASASIDTGKDTKGNKVGAKKSNYRPKGESNKSSEAVNVMKEVFEDVTDPILQSVISKMLEKTQEKSYECPRSFECIELEVESIWPDLFWAKSQVALFLPGQETQFAKLSIYDWHCYMLDENLDVESLFSEIAEEN